MKTKTIYLVLAYLMIYQTMAQKITVRGDMVTNLTAFGNERFLFDEQNLNPKSQPSDKATSERFTIQESNGAINPIFLPMEVVVDFKRSFSLTDVYFFFLNGSSDSIFFYSGTPNNWSNTPFVAKPTTGYNEWIATVVNVNTRYVKIVMKKATLHVKEVIFYGTSTQTEAANPPVTGTAPAPKSMWDFAGSNIFEDGWEDSLLAVSGSHRIYYNLNWIDEDLTAFPNNKYTFGKFNSATRNLDNFFANWKQKNIHLFLCLKENSQRYINSTGNAPKSNLWKPIAPNANPALPASYLEHADAFYQVAARYGSTTVPTGNLRVNTAISPVRTGLNTINYIENGNENNKGWEGRAAYWTPYEYAAMSSADYDGHEKTMGDKVGIKNADPNMKLVMAATIAPDTAYIKAMAHWTTHFRTDKKFIWDVINFHHYSNSVGGQIGDFNSGAVTGVTPEADKLYEKLKEYVAFCRKYWPEKEIWWSEFGYDLHPSSPQRAPAISGQTVELTQANLIVRSILIAAAAGIDRVQQYMLRHANYLATSEGLYNTCGLVNNGNWDGTKVVPPSPHISWYHMFTLRNALRNFVFDSEVSSGNANVKNFKFVHKTLRDSVAFVVWCPTSNNTTVNNFVVNGQKIQGARLVTPTNNSRRGNSTNLTVSNQNVTVNVSETPRYILAKVEGPNSISDPLSSPKGLLIYPNPVEDEINFELPSEQCQVKITDMKGSTIIEFFSASSFAKVPTEILQKGIYLVSVQEKNGMKHSAKVVK
ncbi:MAG: T9SS type A sorting domain-containing protein [Cytophagales bacterium]